LSAKLPVEKTVTQKTSPILRSPPTPGAKALARRADVLSQRLLEFLADTPALTAASVLSNMLDDTSDPATRLAILTTRIEVLRARTIACRLGHPVDGAITLGAVLREQGLMDLPPEILNPILYASTEEPQEDALPDLATNEPLLQMRLLKAYNHEGIDLPEGAVFTIRKTLADDLLERGISEIVPDAHSETPEGEAAPEDEDWDDADRQSDSTEPDTNDNTAIS
jgi:hypothetical protein